MDEITPIDLTSIQTKDSGSLDSVKSTKKKEMIWIKILSPVSLESFLKRKTFFVAIDYG